MRRNQRGRGHKEDGAQSGDDPGWIRDHESLEENEGLAGLWDWNGGNIGSF